MKFNKNYILLVVISILLAGGLFYLSVNFLAPQIQEVIDNNSGEKIELTTEVTEEYDPNIDQLDKLVNEQPNDQEEFQALQEEYPNEVEEEISKTEETYIGGNTKYGPGIYTVGIDIPEGEYKLFSDDSMERAEYWFVNHNTAEEPNAARCSTIDPFCYLTMTGGQYVELTNAYAIPVEEVKAHNGKYKSGQYKVGYDIPPGDYNIIRDENNPAVHYMDIRSNSSGLTKFIIQEQIIENNIHVHLEKGQYLDMRGCHIE